MVMGGEVYLGNATTRASWTLGRQLGLQVAAHILSPFGIRPILDQLAGVAPDVPDDSGLTSAASRSARTTCSST